MNTVSKAKVISSAAIMAKSAFSFSGSPSSPTSGMGSPRISASMPSRISRYPLPPASTTPAFFSTGFISMVWARASWPARMASSNTFSTSFSCAAVSTACLAARRETVSTVPSAGFMTAL